jgi:glycine/sarcosine N-methyltransferase
MSSSRFESSTDSPRTADHDYAQQYSEAFVSRWDELIDWKKRAQGEGHFFIDQLLKNGACTVLDVSTGSGFHAVQLRKAGFKVRASDGSPSMVARARANVVRDGLDIAVECCDWLDLDPRELGIFDAVLCLGSSLCHVFGEQARIAVLERFRALLSPGGVLIVDQRNFQAILGGHFTPSGRYYYCGNTVNVRLGEVNERVCEFVYTFKPDDATYRLRVAPVRPRQLRMELQSAGFEDVQSFGDFKALYDPMRADFIVHVARC